MAFFLVSASASVVPKANFTTFCSKQKTEIRNPKLKLKLKWRGWGHFCNVNVNVNVEVNDYVNVNVYDNSQCKTQHTTHGACLADWAGAVLLVLAIFRLLLQLLDLGTWEAAIYAKNQNRTLPTYLHHLSHLLRCFCVPPRARPQGTTLASSLVALSAPN